VKRKDKEISQWRDKRLEEEKLMKKSSSRKEEKLHKEG
jgi:hypothetical protein